MKSIAKLTAIIFTSLLVSSFAFNNEKTTHDLTIEVKDLRNSIGVVQFTLYNQDGSIPDEHYTKYFKKLTGEIKEGSSSATFYNLQAGKYAVNILHDENKDGKIKKGFILPVEGIGFSNFQSIGLTNRPNFSKASFELKESKSMNVKIIYM